MSGSVWEWVNSIYEDYPYSDTDGREADSDSDSSSLRVRRGGAWHSTYDLRAAFRDGYNPDFADSDLGFRCARSF
jgi:formylglycine-generating enzyme required for sulfatase activity